MKGLLRKDLYMVWNYGRMLLFMSAVFLAFGVLIENENNYFFVIYPVLFGGILPVTLISYDERFGWIRYCDALPVSRRTVVSARYVMALLSFLVLYAVTLLAQAAVLLPRGRLGDLRDLAALLPCFGLLAPAVMLPIVFRWGTEKARIVYFVLVGAFCAGGMLLFDSIQDLSGEIGRTGRWAVLLAVPAVYVLSWLLSVRVFEKREL